MIEAAVAIQDQTPNRSPSYMIQMGEESADADFVNAAFFDCPAGTKVFIEVDNQGTYSCPWTSSIDPFGSGGRFAVALGTSGWEGFWNSQQVGPVINFAGHLPYGYSIARAETYYLTTPPSLSMTWGPSNVNPPMPWAYRPAGSSSYTPVPANDGSTFSDYGGWVIGHPPSPFTITADIVG